CAYDPLEVVDALGVHRQVDELKRRADALLGWGANYVHLVMDARALPDGRVQYRNVADDPAYFDAIAELVDHLTARQVYVLLYLHDDPCLGETPGSTPAQPRHIGAVGPACDRVWTVLATR